MDNDGGDFVVPTPCAKRRKLVDAGVAAEQLTTEDGWPIFDNYFSTVGFVHHHIASYDSFLEYRAQRVIAEQPRVEITLEAPEDGSAFTPTTYCVQYNQLHIRPPIIKEADGSETLLMPAEARLRSMTYAVSLYVDVTLIKIANRGTPQETIEQHDAPQIFFGQVPVMVRSRWCNLNGKTLQERIEAGECEYDEGGYFIINGLEKVFVGQEALPCNQVYVYGKNKVSPWSHISQVRSLGEHSGRSSASAAIIGLQRANGKLQLQMPQIRQPIPLYIVFCALGITERADVEQLLLSGGADDEQLKRFFKPTLLESHMVRQRAVALDYIGKRAAIVAPTLEKRIETARQTLARELLPHLGGDDAALVKACFLGRMARKLGLVALGRSKVDDRDSFGAKRVDLAGTLLESLFKQIMRQMSEEIRKGVMSSVSKGKPVLFACMVKANILTNKMRYSFATGNWGMQRTGDGVKTGVTQPLLRQSLSSMLSHMRRLDQQLPREGKVAQPRLLHTTQWGNCCAAETPEGQACGLVKNLTIISNITPHANNATGVIDLLLEMGMQPLIDAQRVVSLDNCKVVLDGHWIGTTSAPQQLVDFLRHCRRTRRIIALQTSIVFVKEENEINVAIDAGRVVRPLYIVDAQTRRLRLTKPILGAMMRKSPTTLWQDLVAGGYIEYLDVQEQRNAQIAMFPEDVVANGDRVAYTHCELHPATLLGVSASMIPFPDHNQSPRNMYQSAMGKQAMSVASTNALERLDTSAHMLHYPQQPLVQTHFSRNAHFNELPSGAVCIVAILTQPGCNEEDSTVFNQGSVDRGLFRSTFYRTYQERERVDSKPAKNAAATAASASVSNAGCQDIAYAMPASLQKHEKFGKPADGECVNAHNRNYEHLDTDGLAVPGTFCKGRDVIIGKTAPMPVNKDAAAGPHQPTRRDCSTMLRANEDSRVDRVMISDGQDGARLAKVRTRRECVPQVGDKFSSMHGQKGTMGAMRAQEDMPWCASGLVPDIIINPHAVPSRMTAGMLVEMLLGKTAALNGKIGDGTPFSGLTVEQIGDVLHSHGMQRHGSEVMYSGQTGEQLEAMIFIGPCFYQRLKHLSADKIHGRGLGPRTALTHQPVEGRGKDGGLRYGEMERDAGIAHGAAEFTMDRLQYCSDACEMPICSNCGLIGIADATIGQRRCKRCDRNDTVEIARMPYAHKLLTQELMSVGICVRSVLKK